MERNLIDNRYEILKKLGSGGMGEVFKVKDSKNNHILALKLSKDTSIEKEFLTLSKFQHPNIIKVYDFCKSCDKSDISYFTMEYVNGYDLSRLFLKKLPRSKNDYIFLYKVILQICNALGFIHFNKFIHCDIKPGNILVESFDTPEPRVVMTDFGLIEKRSASELKGTLQYIAPEFLKGEKASYNADLFSLGVTLYQVLTGHLPFEGENAFTLIKEHTKSKVKPPREWNSTVPDKLNSIILELLEPVPLKRTKSIGILREAVCEITGKSEPFIAPPFFTGRAKEISFLKDSWQEVKSGKSRVILLTAEEGTGKTRLLQEFKLYAVVEGGKIKEFVPDTINGEETVKDQLILFEKATQKLINEAKNFPVLFIMEDLHLKGDFLVNFLGYLIKSIENIPIFVLLSSTNSELFGEQTRLPKYFEHLQLSTFNSADTGIMVKSMLLTDMEIGSLEDLIYKYTKGNPFLIKTFTQSLVDNGILSYIRGKWVLSEGRFRNYNVPKSIDDFVNRNLEQLNKDELKLLQAGAFLKSNFTLSLLGSLNINTLVIHNLIKKDIIREDFPGHYSFSHNITPAVVVKRISPVQRTLLHKEVAKALELQFKNRLDKVASELAYHYLYSNELEKAYEFAVIAAERAKNSYRNAEAIEYFELALSLSDKLKKKGNRGMIYEALGDVYRMLSNYEEALKQYHNCLASLSNPIPEIYRKIGIIHRDRQNYEEAMGCFKKGLKISSVGSQARVLLLDDIGWINMCNRDFEGAFIFFQDAIKEAKHSGDKFALSYTYNTVGALYLQKMDYEKAREYYMESLKIAQDIKDNNLTRSSLYNLGQILWKRGNLKEAESFYKKALKIVKEQGDIHSTAIYYKSLGRLAEEQGLFNEAFENYNSSLDIFKRVGDKQNMASIYMVMGTAKKAEGNIEEAIRNYEFALTISKEINDMSLLAGIYTTMGNIYKEVGKFNEAIQSLQKAIEIKKQNSDTQDIAYTIHIIGTVYMLQGELKKAFGYLKQSYQLHERQQSKRGMAGASSSLAEYYLLINNLESAKKYCLEGERLSKELKHQMLSGIIHRTLGTVYLRKGDIDGAIASYSSSMDILEKINAKEELAKTAFIMGKEIFSIKQKVGRRFWREGLLEQTLTGLKRSEHIFKELKLDKFLKETRDLIIELEKYSPFIFEPVPGEDKKLKTLYRIAHIVNSTIDIDELLKKILDITVELMEAERGFILVREGDKLEVKIARNMDKQSLKDMLDFSVTIVEDAEKRGELIITSNAQEDERFRSRKSIASYKLLSILCVPFKIKERIVGAIYVDDRRKKDAFTSDDLEFLQAFCNHASIALENALLMKELKTANELLEFENLTMKDELTNLKSAVEGRYSFGSMIGKSGPMQKIYDTLEKIAKYDSPVVIEGETGTGKELAANIIHYNSSRKGGNFIAVNSSAIPDNLLESEIFGHVKGAFTGALNDKPGLFEIADEGTIFFDEIGELNPNLQAKLLRIIQDGELRRVGATTTKKVNARIIAATNKTLEEEVKNGRFREDLYYRLKVMSVKLPPLRERGEDILLLANSILRKTKKRLSKKIKGFTPEAAYLLQSYSWPGNVRELENVIERVIIMTEDTKISEKDLSELLAIKGMEKNRFIFPCSLDVLEKKAIEAAREVTKNRKRNMIKILGISRPTLDKKLKKYDLE